MARIAQLAFSPVEATVITSFEEYKEGERVTIDRVTEGAKLFGVMERERFIPRRCVDKSAADAVLRHYRPVYGPPQ